MNRTNAGSGVERGCKDGAAAAMLMVLRRACQTTASDSSLGCLPWDVLQLVRAWVLYSQLGFVGLCEYGYIDELNYVTQCPRLAEVPSRSDVNHSICCCGSLSVCKLLVETFGADVNVVVNQRTAVMKASLAGRLDIVQYLVAQGADFSAGDNYALQLGCRRGHIGVAEYLVSLGADISANDDYALRWSAREGMLESVRFLLDNGAGSHAGNLSYALQLASMSGRLEVVKFLVSRGANIRAKSCYALRVASSNGHADVARYLSRELDESA